jgi:uncharacterized membrane protein YfcA
MWLLLGLALAAGWTFQHAWNAATIHLALVGLPFTMGGLAVGEFLHHRIDAKRFRSVVNLTLIAVGVVLAWSACK